MMQASLLYRLNAALGPKAFCPRFFCLRFFPGVFFCAVFFFGCDHAGSGTAPNPVVDEGAWITDTTFTIDAFPFGSEACMEVFPAGSANSEIRDSDAVASLRIIATACYHVRVTVTDSAKDTVRTFDSRFGIFNRTEAEKNRGVVGYVSWDGKDDNGAVLPRGLYLWRMDFDFGAGRARKFRADFLLP